MFRKLILFTIGLSLLAACGTIAPPVYQDNDAGVDAVRTVAPTEAPTETPLPTLTPTNTPVPPTETPIPTEAPTETPLPEPTATSTPIPAAEEPETEAASAGDAANGQILFNEMRNEVSFSCATCHSPDTNMRLIGPGFLGLGETAATRVEGMSAEDYLRESILHPNNYIVEDENGVPYPASLMPQTYADVWTDEQVEDLIAYLLGL